MRNVLWFYLSLKGRISRREFLIYLIAPAAIAGVAAAIIVEHFKLAPAEETKKLLTIVAILLLLWPSIAVQVKQWHDVDKSGWWVLIGLIPIVGLWAFIVNGFFRGTKGNNRFGSDPAGDTQHGSNPSHHGTRKNGAPVRSSVNLKDNVCAKPEKAAAVQGGNGANDPLTLSRRVRIIAWCQVLAAVLILLARVTTLESLRGSLLWSWMPIFVLVVGVNAVAGIQTLRRRRVGYWLSIWNHVAQIPVIAFPGLTFTYFGLGGVVGYLALQRLAINDQILKFGIEAEFEPGFEIMLGGTPEFYKVGIDLLAIAFVTVLLSALRLSKTGG